MLLEFRVKNFRSIKNEINFSMVASSDKSLPENCITTQARGFEKLLTTSVIYGANGSGKTSFVEAFAFFHALVTNSPNLILGQNLNTNRFKLDEHSKNEPSEFEITLLIDSIRYQYGFILNETQILKEWLYAYVNSKPQEWFVRESVESDSPQTTLLTGSSRNDVYEFSSYFKGKKQLLGDSTRSNVLFLSQAVALNNEQLRPLWTWIAHGISIIGAGLQPSNDSTIELITSGGPAPVVDFMGSADLSISDIKLETQRIPVSTIKFESGQGPIFTSEEQDMVFPKFIHKSNSGYTAVLALEEESQGTRKIFALAGPILKALQIGGLLIADELNSSLHPLLIRWIIKHFHNAKTNIAGTQLIFTTHDTSLLNDTFRNDQIWIIDKNSDHESYMTPLSDYKIRKTEKLERSYLVGRFGGTPYLGHLENEI